MARDGNHFRGTVTEQNTATGIRIVGSARRLLHVREPPRYVRDTCPKARVGFMAEQIREVKDWRNCGHTGEAKTDRTKPRASHKSENTRRTRMLTVRSSRLSENQRAQIRNTQKDTNKSIDRKFARSRILRNMQCSRLVLAGKLGCLTRVKQIDLCAQARDSPSP